MKYRKFKATNNKVTNYGKSEFVMIAGKEVDSYNQHYISLDSLRNEHGDPWEEFVQVDIEPSQSESKMEIQDQIHEYIRELLKKNLTEHQHKVYELIFSEDLTYRSAAAKLGINYTAIPNCVNGFKRGGKSNGNRHGGILNKVKKLLLKDEYYWSLVEKLRESEC